MLLHEVGSGTRAVTENALARHGISLRPAMTLAGTEVLEQMAAIGAGLAILSAQAIHPELEANRLTVVPFREERLVRPLYRVQLEDAWPSPALQTFLNLLAADRIARGGEEEGAGRLADA